MKKDGGDAAPAAVTGVGRGFAIVDTSAAMM
jgi:hypothetical protein